MAEFTVTIQMSSSYDDDQFDLTETVCRSFEADTLDDLFEILDDGEFADEIDDTPVLNSDTDDSPIEVNFEYVLIQDESGAELYRDEDYTG